MAGAFAGYYLMAKLGPLTTTGERSLLGSKKKMTESRRHPAFDHHLPATVQRGRFVALIGSSTPTRRSHGILVQLPLPAQIDAQKVIAAIDPAKDVDGFHPLNAGRSPRRCRRWRRARRLAASAGEVRARLSLAGLDAVVIGRSNIVGKPLAQCCSRELRP